MLEKRKIKVLDIKTNPMLSTVIDFINSRLELPSNKNTKVSIIKMSEIEILRNFVWNENIPTIIIILIIINLYKGFSSKESHKEDYSSCIDFKCFLKRFNKRKNPIRNALLVSNSLVLFHQIYKQVKYRYGFPYLYGPLFIILPIIYILIDIVSSYVIWKKST